MQRRKKETAAGAARLYRLPQLAVALGVSYRVVLGYRRAGVLASQGRFYDLEDSRNRIARSTIIPWHYVRPGWQNLPKTSPQLEAKIWRVAQAVGI